MYIPSHQFRAVYRCYASARMDCALHPNCPPINSSVPELPEWPSLSRTCHEISGPAGRRRSRMDGQSHELQLEISASYCANSKICPCVQNHVVHLSPLSSFSIGTEAFLFLNQLLIILPNTLIPPPSLFAEHLELERSNTSFGTQDPTNCCSRQLQVDLELGRQGTVERRDEVADNTQG